MTFRALGTNINQINGNNNIVTDNYIITLIQNLENKEDLAKKIENQKQRIIKNKNNIVDKLFFALFIFAISIIFFTDAFLTNHYLIAVVITPFWMIPLFKASKYFKEISSLNLQITSANDVLKEVYKLMILDKIKDNTL